jgi:hypothetical protein
MTIQSVLFVKTAWTKERAVAWLKRHGHRYGKVHVTENYLRYRQLDPALFKSLRIHKPRRSTVHYIVGAKK